MGNNGPVRGIVFHIEPVNILRDITVKPDRHAGCTLVGDFRQIRPTDLLELPGGIVEITAS